jgi:hypothetical protein
MGRHLLQSENKKGALEISFGWLFAIIAGAVIIFLAIYISSRIINSSQETASAETGKEIEILLNPMETSFESSQMTSMTIPTETRINNICEESGNFGRQGIRLDQKSFGKWVETSTNVFFTNKYIFSDGIIEGRKFYLFSKPFSLPFKVADLIYIIPSTKQYCFEGAPSDIAEEISNLNKNVITISNCSEDSVKVCFNSAGCDISVNINSGTVTKNRTKMYYSGIGEDDSLMYAAIFSDKTTYECQLSRLILRMKRINDLYREKAAFVEKAGCEEIIIPYLNEFESLMNSFSNSLNLGDLATKAIEIENVNKAGECLTW